MHTNIHEEDKNSLPLHDPLPRLDKRSNFKIITSILSLAFLTISVFVALILVRQGQDIRERAKSTPSYNLTAIVEYTKDDPVPEFAKGLIAQKSPIDYAIVRLKDSLGAPVTEMTQSLLLSVSSVTLPDIANNSQPITVSKVRTDEHPIGGVVWYGNSNSLKSNSYPSNQIFIGSYKKLMGGNLVTANHSYDLLPLTDGYYLMGIFEVPEFKDGWITSTPDSKSDFSPESPTGLAVIDMLLAYTPVAAQESGGTAYLVLNALLSLGHTNTAFSLSPPMNVLENSVRIRIIGIIETPYVEPIPSIPLQDTLHALAENGDGVLDIVHPFRDQLGADFVLLITRNDPNAGAMGYAYTPVTGPSNSFAVVQRHTIGSTSTLSMSHEIGHLFGAMHKYCPTVNPPECETVTVNPNQLYGHGYKIDLSGTSYRTILNSNFSNIQRMHYSTPLLEVVPGVPMGNAEYNDNARLIYERRNFLAGLFVPNYTSTPPSGPTAASCDIWVVSCHDGSQFNTTSCTTQQQFNSNWWESWPGGGYGRWQYEACLQHGGAVASICPNQQQDPIKWCATLDCPNGDTNGDARCTVDDNGGNTQEVKSGAFCTYPDSGQGDINIYSGAQSQIDWNTYCGTTYKYLASSNPDISCNPDNVIMSASPNPAQVGQNVTFSLAGSTEGDTWVEDYWAGGFNCSGTVTPGQPKTCQANANGTYTWTHKWKKCVGSPTNCSNLCTKSTVFVVGNPTPTPTPTPQPPTVAPGLDVNTTSTGTTLTWNYPTVVGATSYKVERCFGSNCSGFSEIATVNHPTTTYTDTQATTSTSTYKYRVRGANQGGYGPYSRSLVTRVNYSFTAQVVCQNGNTPTLGADHRMRIFWLKWPPNPQTFQEFLGPVGQTSYTFPITSFNSINNYYIRNVAFIGSTSPGNVFLNAVGNTQYPNDITVSNYFNYPTTMYRITRNTIPGGTSLQLKYYGPPEWCN